MVLSSYKNISCIDLALSLGLEKGENGKFHCFRPEQHRNKDIHPSLSITHNYFHCFACGAKGNNVELVKSVLNLDTAEAIKKIEELANIKSETPSQEEQNANQSATKTKAHCRMISQNEPRFVWLDSNNIKTREVRLNDLSEIYSQMKKIWTLRPFEALGVQICDDPYSLVFPFGSQQFCYNPKNAESYLVCEGRTDLLTLLSISADSCFGIISRYNKSQKIKLHSGSSFYFLLDSDEKPQDLAKLIEQAPENAKFYAIQLPDIYKDISEWSYSEPNDFLHTLLNYLQENYKNSLLDNEIFEINYLKQNKFQAALDEVRIMIDNKRTNESPSQLSSAEELLKKDIPPLSYIVQEMLAETCYGIISGRPKCGKSWLMLNLCIALASGGKFLGKFDCTQSKVLYLALEDSERRMQSRLKTILSYEEPNSRKPLDNLFILYKIQRFNDGGKEQLRQYITDNQIKVVVIDTQKRFTTLGRNSYDNDFEYKIGQELQSFALENNICLISVLHNRKQKGDGTPMDEIAGTYGISAGADFWAILKRGKQGSNFCFGGRDVLDKELLLTFDDRCVWNAIGDENEVAESQVRVKWENIIISDDMQKKEVVASLMRQYECSIATAYKWIVEAIKNKILYTNGKFVNIS